MIEEGERKDGERKEGERKDGERKEGERERMISLWLLVHTHLMSDVWSCCFTTIFGYLGFVLVRVQQFKVLTHLIQNRISCTVQAVRTKFLIKS